MGVVFPFSSSGHGGRSGPVSTKPSSASWQCSVCTYVNTKPMGVVCEVCESPRLMSGPPKNAPQEPRQRGRCQGCIDDAADQDAHRGRHGCLYSASQDSDLAATQSQPGSPPSSPNARRTPPGKRRRKIQWSEAEIATAQAEAEASVRVFHADAAVAARLQADERKQAAATARERADQESMGLAVALQLTEQEREQAATLASPKRRFLGLSRDECRATLTACQKAALEFVDTKAGSAHALAYPQLIARLDARSAATRGGTGTGVGGGSADVPHPEPTAEIVDRCLRHIQDEAPIIVHLSEVCLKLLLHDTEYRGQFETGTSSGANNLASRTQWEDAMFHKAYAGAKPEERVKYGCLNVTGDIEGVQCAKSYGSFFLVLAPHVRDRTTFSDRDTGGWTGAESLATNQFYAHCLLKYSDAELTTVLTLSRIHGASSRSFTVYKECQIHGKITLATDVQALSVPAGQASASAELRGLVDRFQRQASCNILWQTDLLGS